MENLWSGVSTVLICSIGYFYAWKYQNKDNFQIAVLLLLLCGLFLRIYAASDLFLHPWDERYHALVAKNMMQHPLLPTLYEQPVFPVDYKNWAENHIWVHKQPLPLWAMSLSLYLFGVNEIALRIPSILLTSIGILLTFQIASYFFDKKVGFLAAFLYSINGLIIEMTAGRIATDHIDAFFLFFVELAIFFTVLFVQKQKTIYNIFVGMSIGAAILCKWLPALIVLPIWVLLVWDSEKFSLKTILIQFFVLLFVTIILFLPWQWYIFHTFPTEANWEASFNMKHITEALEGQTGPFYYFFDKIRINYGEFIYLPLAYFSWKTATNFNDKKRLAIFLWFWIPFIFFSITKTKMQGYILFTAPALFMMTADFWFILREKQANTKYKWLLKVLLFLIVALPIRYTIERVKPFQTMERNPEWAIALRNLNDKKIINGVLFNYKRPIEAMFLTDLTVYEKLPDAAAIRDLIAKGYNVLLCDDGKIPSEMKEIKGVEIVELK